MLGLGLGSLIGGYLADKRQHKIISLFIILELLIGCFGLGSESLIKLSAKLLASHQLYVTAIVSFFILILPTAMMGCTLPMLIKYLQQYTYNTGESTGTLYFSNSMGAALGALITGFYIFQLAGLSEAIVIAAILNFITAALALLLLREKS